MNLSRPTLPRRLRPLLVAVAAVATGWPVTGFVSPASGTAVPTITTIAGAGHGRTPLGRTVELSGPRTAAVDAAGTIWFTDTGHHQIKRLDPATGIVTVVAGTGLAGTLGDGGPALGARLDMPHGVAVDNDDSPRALYIADSANNRIRMVNLGTGVISTVAGTGLAAFGGDGGPATTAHLDHPRFLVVAPDGSLLIADTGNNRVRRVDPGGTITTIAGTGRRGYSGDGGPALTADLDDPRGLALDGDGSLYISNAEGVATPAVRRVDPTGIITTVAGGRPAGFAGDGGPATMAALNSPRSIALWGRELYIADSDNSRIRMVHLDTGIITTVVGTGAFGFGGDGGPALRATVDQPRGVAVTPAGDLVVGDTRNGRLRLVRMNRAASSPPGSPPVAVPPAAVPPVTVPPAAVPPVTVPPVEIVPLEAAPPIDTEPAPTSPGPVLLEGASPALPVSGESYRLVASDGGIFAFGGAGFFGSTGAVKLAKPIVGMASTPSGLGYWLVASDGGVFAFGDAGFFGSTGAITLAKPIVGMAPTPSGGGYWLVASDGGIFAFGDAGFFGSTGAVELAKPIVGMAPSATGNGYRLVASDGGIFAFGDAAFFGSTGGVKLARPIVGMAATPSDEGYWLLASDGGIFAFGDARFLGSPAGQLGGRTAVGLLASPTGRGYRVATSDGGIFAYGDAPFAGELPGGLRLPVVGIAG